MVINLVKQLERRRITGCSVKNVAVLCHRCPPCFESGEYALEICEHIFYNHEGLENFMWQCPSKRIDSRDKYDPVADMWYNDTYYIIKTIKNSYIYDSYLTRKRPKHPKKQ